MKIVKSIWNMRILPFQGRRYAVTVSSSSGSSIPAGRHFIVIEHLLTIYVVIDPTGSISIADSAVFREIE